MTAGPVVTVLDSPAACAAAAATLLADRAAAAIRARGEFALVLAGGSTPAAMFAVLVQPGAYGRVDWSRVHVFWGDERAVPPEHPASNFGGARSFLDAAGVPESQVHRIEGELGAVRAAARYATRLAAWREHRAGRAMFDLAFLGIGPDGHTASLFPGQPPVSGLAGTGVAPDEPRERITLSLEALAQAFEIVFVATGTGKAAAVAAAIEAGPDPAVPASLVRAGGGTTRWLLDRNAAAALRPAWTGSPNR